MIFALSSQPFLQNPTLQRIGWALVHSVWQDAVIALCLAILLLFVSKSSIRYLLGCMALLAMMVLPIATFALRPQARVVSNHSIERLISVHTLTVPIEDVSHRTELAIAAVIWIGGVLLLCLRQLGGWLVIMGMRRNAIAVTDQRLLGQLNMLASKYGIHHKVALAASSMVQVPCIVGFLKPIVLFPCSTLTELSPAHLESLLAHELAHVRRHDYLVNLVQTVVETLLFYHPAAWWVSRQIRIEREYCCDDLAIRMTGDRHLYCEAMAAMEQIRASKVPLVMAANGGSLLVRLRRLLEPSTPRSFPLWPAIILPIIVIAFGICLAQAQSTSVAVQRSQSLSSVTENPPQIPEPSGFTLQRSISPTIESSLINANPFEMVRWPDGSYHSAYPLMLEPPMPAPKKPDQGRTAPITGPNYRTLLFAPGGELVGSFTSARLTGKMGSGTLNVQTGVIDDQTWINRVDQMMRATTQPVEKR